MTPAQSRHGASFCLSLALLLQSSDEALCEEDEARRDVQGWREGLIEITRADASARAAGSLPRDGNKYVSRPQGVYVRDAQVVEVGYCREGVGGYKNTTAIKVWQWAVVGWY